MSELTTGQLIKIIIGIFVVAAVAIGLYLFFKEKIIGFFQGISPEPTIPGIFIALLK